MAVITISRQAGCQGTGIARDTGRQLGYRVVEREVINQSARRAGAPAVALAEIDELNLFGIQTSAEDRQAYQAALDAVLHELAAEGSIVIVGRAGQVILAGYPGSLHVRLYAPENARIENHARLKNLSLSAAAAQVKALDRSRQKFLENGYHQKINNPDLYDLMINTARLPRHEIVDLICQAARHLP